VGLFGSDKKKVLLIDDDPMPRSMLGMFFQEIGYEVLEASDGKQGIQVAVEGAPVLILCDINMPGMTGIETLQYLQGNPKTKPIPVIMVTAHGELDAVERCLESGARDYIQKPFDLMTVKSKVERALGAG
jgi:CheY-like chemotaxis protein